ncbi:MAG: 6,7-dimethyl-8-ribityllumazine synthase [Porphyromonas sp.]|nr:6,7-dimethyl-8-ribityllumazine synthase [Porphyromonas sp.]
MATINLSEYNPDEIPSGKGKTVSIAVSEWNGEVTQRLLEGAIETLMQHDVRREDINVVHVPGSFELIYACHSLSSGMGQPHVIIALGAVIRGETPHFDYISQAVAINLGKLNATTKTPIVMGVLTTDNMQQALDRAGGSKGNKGVEAAVTALKMIDQFVW